MRDELKPVQLQFGGLQIFSPWKKNQQNADPKHPILSSCTYPLLSSEETLSGSSLDNNSGYLGQWKRVSERTNSEILHDYSPTIVNSETFTKNSVTPETVKTSQRVANWDRFVNDIFNELPFESRDQFLEEFQYAVISSGCLNDISRNVLPCSLKKSIMDFHNKSQTFTKAPSTLTIPTKYGRLKICGTSKFYLVKTLDYLRTLLLSHRVLRFLRRTKPKNLKSTKKIVSVLLMAVYLAIQQEFFNTQYTKYKTLVTLKEMLKNLQKFNALLSKYHLRFKELAIHEPFGSESGSDNTYVLSNIKELLSSTLDLSFHNIKRITTNLFALSNTTTLAKYCEIYGLHNSDLVYYFNHPANDIEAKAKRFHVLKKFMLCCLLSLNHSNSQADLPMLNPLSNIFPNFDCTFNELEYFTDSDRLKSVNENLCELKFSIETLTSSLVSHRSILYSTEGTSSSSSTPPTHRLLQNNSQDVILDGRHKSHQISMTLNTIKQLEDVLHDSFHKELSIETKAFVTTNLERLLDYWQKKSHVNKPERHSPIIPSNRGFSLDVLQPATARTSIETSTYKKVYLNSDIDFRSVDETQSDIELDSDKEGLTDDGNYDRQETTEECNANHKFKGLSDEELRSKLNEGILKFAVENNQGRERLRTQKSFELLRRVTQKKNSPQYGCRHSSSCNPSDKTKNTVKSRSPYTTQFSSEESIPVLYELKELLETH